MNDDPAPPPASLDAELWTWSERWSRELRLVLAERNFERAREVLKRAELDLAEQETRSRLLRRPMSELRGEPPRGS